MKDSEHKKVNEKILWWYERLKQKLENDNEKR